MLPAGASQPRPSRRGNGENPQNLPRSYSLHQTSEREPASARIERTRACTFIFFVVVRCSQSGMRLWYERVWSVADTPIPHAAQICPSEACLANLTKKKSRGEKKKLPQSTQKPRLVSHTLAAKSPQGRGGDEAECLLAAVKSSPQSFSCIQTPFLFFKRIFFLTFFFQKSRDTSKTRYFKHMDIPE